MSRKATDAIVLQNLSLLIENQCLTTLERGEMPVCIVLCEESPYYLVLCFTPFFCHFPNKHFYNAELTYTSNACKMAGKIAKVL